MSNIINGMGHTFVEGLIESQRSKKRRVAKAASIPNQFRKVHKVIYLDEEDFRKIKVRYLDRKYKK